jgi:hypothetical protein
VVYVSLASVLAQVSLNIEFLWALTRDKWTNRMYLFSTLVMITLKKEVTAAVGTSASAQYRLWTSLLAVGTTLSVSTGPSPTAA